MEFEYYYGKQSGQYAFYRIPKQLFADSQFDVLSYRSEAALWYDDRPYGSVTEKWMVR